MLKAKSWWLYLLLGWLTFVVGLLFATIVGTAFRNADAPNWLWQIVQAIIVTGTVIPSIYLLQRKLGLNHWNDLGLSRLKKGIPYVFIGAGLVIILAGTGLMIAYSLGWIYDIRFHFSSKLVLAFLVNVLFAFFYEAFPEEVVFRGYTYHILTMRVPRIVALLVQPVLFVLAPLAVVSLQELVGIGGMVITVDYIILLLGFGLMLQFLRILTNNLWTSIGFHLAFLEVSRFFIQQQEQRFLSFKEVEAGTGDVFVAFFMVIVVGIVLMMILSIVLRKKIRWFEKSD
ncbi:type II CAAX prenyl endopeptidase Rce1 family protein [Sporosarcina limicola]|uniref:Membrane protease YdiL (CAAX protease family) n=1 Tax=Sporosarcina limicola TaxID=34101 RepID=A0A927MEB2_9BACL|nr:membrane protease YdiL (CAAX protease family) [Sporosarcina limicola]